MVYVNMEGNGADESSGSECNGDGSKIAPQTKSVDRDLIEIEYLNSKKDTSSDESNQSGEEETSILRTKKRVQLLSDSDGDTNETINRNQDNIPSENESNSSECSSKSMGLKRHKSILQKSRLRKMSTSGDESNSANNIASSNEDEQESRIKSKRNKLRQKFKNLHTKKTSKITLGTEYDQENKSVEDVVSSSVENIKQILKSSLYDPDTSDEESSVPNKKPAVQKKERKSTKPTSPKPLRMSAKQAMENMQKIKSESNRMLREKEVSLPYHRPKALTLKDIMSRRRVAVTADGKALPIKMNDEQLKQYAQILEERQKEVIELCKSDTEEEEEVEKTENENVENLPDIASQNDTLYNDLSKTEDQINTDLHITDEAVGTDNIDTDNKENPANNDTLVNKEVLNTEADVIDINIKESESKTNELQTKSIGTIDEPISQGHENKPANKNNSMEMELVYNDSVEETSLVSTGTNYDVLDKTEATYNSTKSVSEVNSQLISLHYDIEKSENNTEQVHDAVSDKKVETSEEPTAGPSKTNHEVDMITENIQNNDFSDDGMNIEDIDELIENAEIALSQNHTGNVNSPMLIKEPLSLTAKPKLTGAPGMVIDLDGTDPLVPKKLSGVELLKERFVYFAKLKTPEELERAREKRIKPGMQHLKLKMELEEQIAEQRSLEWAKRLEEEKQHQNELKELRGEGSDVEEDIDAIEAKLEKEDAIEKDSSSESEEEEPEQEILDKPRKRNPMVDDEAEESDCGDEEGEEENNYNEIGQNDVDGNEQNADDDADNEADESDDESSEESDDSDVDQQNKPKKGRILKAFEDSDDEDSAETVQKDHENKNNDVEPEKVKVINSEVIKNTLDDELHLAQKSLSDDLFTSQDSSVVNSGKSKVASKVTDNNFEDKQFGTQTFSILEGAKENTDTDFPMPDTLSGPRDTQPFGGDSLDAVVGMCSGSFSQTQNLVPLSQMAGDVSVSQAIGDDVLALCTGQFYDNKFVSQEESKNIGTSNDNLQEDVDISTKVNNDINTDNNISTPAALDNVVHTTEIANSSEDDQMKLITADKNTKTKTSEDPSLKSILDELNDPAFDTPKQNKYFVSNDTQDKENKQSIANAQYKKKFVIDSDEEAKEEDTNVKKRKIKKKKLEQRALQISDDEEDIQDEAEEYESELEEEHDERVVEYDSEENEVIVQPQHAKKKRKLGEFFEQEAELTSEDEWIGSGDEDEAGLDRMEREEGDDDTFNEKKLQRELGQIHMRDVLDQDKREVRLIQELLFEDADLGGGSRQRKFRWQNADGEEETGTYNDEFADTQEEEFESEEQWRKQRHEREMFLKSLKNQEEPDESLNTSVNRTSIIKASLSKNTSNIFVEVNSSIEEIEVPASEKKTVTAKDIPSPKKPFTIFQQNYHGSLLTRGRGALARLAALATPLTNDDDTPKVGSLKPTSKRNFVFASIDAPTPDDDEPKVTKRKAASDAGTPRLVKKLRTEDKQKYSKSSLLDHMKL